LFASTNNIYTKSKRENNFGKVIRTGDLSVEIINDTTAKLLKKKKSNTPINLDPKS
jgi:hypothetical protein